MLMAQQSKVSIVKDELGNVIRISKNNPDFGHVRLTQDAVTYTVTGWVKKQVKSTLLHGLVEDLKAVGIQKKKTLPGCIYTTEQFEAFSSDNPDRDLKVAGLTGIICCKDGEPIYRKSFYDPTGTMEDTLVAHNNGQAIREANSSEVVERLKDNVTDESMINETETPEVDKNQVDLEDAIAEVEEEVTEEEEIVEEKVPEEEVEEEATFEL